MSIAARRGRQAGHASLEAEEEPADRKSAEKLQVSLSMPSISIRPSGVTNGSTVVHILGKLIESYLSEAGNDELFINSVLALLQQKPDAQIARAEATTPDVYAGASMAEGRDVGPGQAVLFAEDALVGKQESTVGLLRNSFPPGFCCFRVVRRQRTAAAWGEAGPVARAEAKPRPLAQYSTPAKSHGTASIA